MDRSGRSSVFEQPDTDVRLLLQPAARRSPPVKLLGSTTKLLVSNNQPAPVEHLVASPRQVSVILPGKIGGVVTSADEHFLQTRADVSGKVFDAVRDFGAKGDELADDTIAIQSAIDAARQCGKGAIAYLPTGRYRVSRTLLVTGHDYSFKRQRVLLRTGLARQGRRTDNGSFRRHECDPGRSRRWPPPTLER